MPPIPSDRNRLAQAEAFVPGGGWQEGRNDETAVILFGANALVERPMSGLAELAPITSVPQPLHTDLAEAIRLGLALFPAGSARRMVILSDGAATLGDAEARGGTGRRRWRRNRLRAAGAPGRCRRSPADQRRCPHPHRPGRNLPHRSDRPKARPMPAALRILAGGSIVYEEACSCVAGVNNFSIRLRASEQEFARYRVQLTPTDDTFYQNNELAAFTEIVGPPRILVVANDGTLDDRRHTAARRIAAAALGPGRGRPAG